MKAKRVSIAVLATVMLLSVCLPALAATITPFASPVFSSATALLDSDGEAGFSCITAGKYKSVTLKSVSYQYKKDGKWVSGGSLSKPSKPLTSASAYKGSISYSMPSGKTCRLVAVFSADGTTTTAYSKAVDF